MANTKISALTELTGANVVTADDVLPIVDTSVTTTKKIKVDELAIATRATQAEMEAGSSANTTVAPSVQHFHPSAAKAWCYFTVSGGTPALEESYNVTSITDNGVGDYTINFTNALETAEYAAHVSGVPVSNGTVQCVLQEKAGGTRSTTAFQIAMLATGGGAGGAVDTTRGSVVIFGNMP